MAKKPNSLTIVHDNSSPEPLQIHTQHGVVELAPGQGVTFDYARRPTFHSAAAVLGKKGGKVKSARKTEAARRNAKLPRKKRHGKQSNTRH